MTFSPGDRVVFTEHYGNSVREGDTGTVLGTGPAPRGSLVSVRMDGSARRIAAYHFRMAPHVDAPLSADGEPLLVGDTVLILKGAHYGDVWASGTRRVDSLVVGKVGKIVERPSHRPDVAGNVYVEGVGTAYAYRVEASSVVHYSEADFDAVAAPEPGDTVRVTDEAMFTNHITGETVPSTWRGYVGTFERVDYKGRAILGGYRLVNLDGIEVVTDPAPEPEPDPEPTAPAPAASLRKVGDLVRIVTDVVPHGLAVGTVAEIVEADDTDDMLPWRVLAQGVPAYTSVWVGPDDVVDDVDLTVVPLPLILAEITRRAA